MKFSVMYLLNDSIYYLKKDNANIIKFSIPKNILKYGKINNIKSFEKYFKKMLEENNLTKIITNGNIKIIINEMYSQVDKSLLKEICKELNFNKIIFIDEREIIKDFKNKVYLIIYNDYTLMHYKKNNKVETKVFIGKNISYESLFNNIENQEVFISKDFDNFEKFHYKYYVFQDYSVFLMEKVYNMNKVNKKLDL